MSETVYEYDEAGRVISRTKNLNQRNEQHETFVWNGFNQLTTFNDKHCNQWFYKYDGLGRRIEKYSERNNTTIKYIWDGDQLALTLTFNQGKLINQRHSVFNVWELLAQQDSYENKPTTHYGVSQPNGKILGLFTPEGELAWKAEKRTLWGICFNWHKLAYPNQIDPEMLFAGQWLDNESGLAYNRYRYYDPESGNYLCLDPIGLSGGNNPYRYAKNPIDWVDLFGLAGCKSKNTDILGEHGVLRNNSAVGQSHHLNQDAAYRDIIPMNKGAAIKLEGNAFTQPGTPHYEAHKSLEVFWDRYRKGGSLYGSKPTNLQYTRALKTSLNAAGLPKETVNEAVRYSIRNRIQYGALGGMAVPRIPGRINQVIP